MHVLKVNEWKQIHYAKTSQEKVELATLISDKYVSEQKILP